MWRDPVIVADRVARTPTGIALLVELAETLQAPVIDRRGRMNFPSRHPLNQTESAGQLIAGADVILGLELFDFWGTVSAVRDALHRTSRSRIRQGTKLISITAPGSLHEEQLPGLPAVSGGGRRDGRRCRGHAPGTHRGLPEPPHRRSAPRLRRAPTTAGGGARPRPGQGARRGGVRVERLADQHGAAGRRGLGSDQERGLGPRVRERQQQRLGVPSVGLRPVLSPHRRLRGRGRRLRARQPPWAVRSPTRSRAESR